MGKPSCTVFKVLKSAIFLQVDPSEKGGYTNLAYETDSGELQSGATGTAPVPAGRSQDEGDKVDITWWFALCFPAVVSGNKDGTSLSEDQGKCSQLSNSNLSITSRDRDCPITSCQSHHVTEIV